MNRVRPLIDLLQLFVAPGVWFAHFVVIYGTEALICRTPNVPAARVMIVVGAAATVAALAALAAFAMLIRRAIGDKTAEHTGAAFLHRAALLLALLSAFAVAWTASPIALLPVCAG